MKLINIFNKAREYLAYPLHAEKPQKFISYWKPQYKIGHTGWYISKDYNSETRQYDLYKISELTITGYEFTFSIDETGNITGKADYQKSGNNIYNFTINDKLYKTQEKAQAALTKLQGEK